MESVPGPGAIELLSSRLVIIMMDATRKRYLSKAEDLQPQNRRRYTMANTQLKGLLMSVCVLVTQTTKGAFGVITLAPLNRVVYEGVNNTKIDCQSSNTDNKWSRWTLFPFDFPGNSGSVYLMNIEDLSPSYADTFALEYSQDATATLVVFNATISPSVGASFSTAGIYYIEDGEEIRGGHLVVLRTDPICSTSLTQSGDVIQLSCTIVYGSYREYPIDANMTWSVNGQPIPNGNANFTINSSPTEVTASSTLLINDNVGGSYECKTTFNRPAEGSPGELQGLGSNLATNTPDYLKTCTISVIGPSTTTTAGVMSSTAHKPPCTPNIIQLLLDLILRARCYNDWLSCSYLGSLVQTCPNYCKLLHFSGGKCETPTSVDCPCIPPGIKKCNCF